MRAEEIQEIAERVAEDADTLKETVSLFIAWIGQGNSIPEGTAYKVALERAGKLWAQRLESEITAHRQRPCVGSDYDKETA